MMELNYPHKRPKGEILNRTKPAFFEGELGGSDNSLLIEGDNLRAMKTLLTQYGLRAKVDLVYIDPPFATNSVYRHNGDRTATISPSNSDDIAYSDKLKGAEFLEFLRERLVFINELMAEHASIYLHIDYKIGHYVKIVMDEIFGIENFRNDITRVKCNPKNFSRKGYSNLKDMILFYTKSDDFVWNEPTIDFNEADIIRLFPKVDSKGRRYTTTPLHAPGETQNGDTGKEWKGQLPPSGRHWRYSPAVLDELDSQGLIEWSSTGNPRKIQYATDAEKRGKRLQDIWEFKDPPYPNYPTEKNLDLLRTIIRTSSEPGQRVFDCFCGSGTTLYAAQELGRHWIGIDESPIAIATTKKRLSELTSDLFTNTSPFAFLKEAEGVERNVGVK